MVPTIEQKFEAMERTCWRSIFIMWCCMSAMFVFAFTSAEGVSRSRNAAPVHKVSGHTVTPSVRVRFDRDHDRVRFFLAGESIPVETSCRTAETAGFNGDCEYNHLHKDTVLGLIESSRTSKPITDIVTRAHAASFGLLKLPDEPVVRLNVGGMRLVLPRDFLETKFAYSNIISGALAEPDAKQVFIDKDAHAFCELLRQAARSDAFVSSGDMLVEII